MAVHWETGDMKRKQGFPASLCCWEASLVARPGLAAVRVLAVLAPEAGSWEEDFLADSLARAYTCFISI